MVKITAAGYLTSIAETIFSDGGMENKTKLQTNDLERICTIYGHLAKKSGDLYGLLFEAENERIECDGQLVNTKDFMWFTILDHTYARGWYWKPTSKATVDTSVNHGVPLAFKGARRVFNKSYMSWFNEVKDYDKSEWIKCDMFLPQGLNSFRIDSETGKLDQEITNPSRGGYKGLIHHYLNSHTFTLEEVRRLREEVPKYTSTARPKKVAPGNISEEPNDTTAGDLYNDSSYLMRCMILQGWCWYKPSRHLDQITDPKDWDNFIPSVDSIMSNFDGIRQKDTRIPSGFLKFTKTKEEDLLIPEEEDYEQDGLKLL